MKMEFLYIRHPKSKIPYSTLQKRYRKSEQANPRLGRKPVFSSAQERILADHLIHMTNLFYGLDSMKFRKIAYQCAEQLKIPHNFNKESKCAGPDWLEGFLKRNTDISVRKPESTSINRIEGFNKEEVNLFYKNLEELMIKNKYEAHQIFNMDETGVSTIQEAGKVLAKRGQKRVGTICSWERGKTVTAVCANSYECVQIHVPSVAPQLDDKLNSVLALISPQPSTSREVRKRTHKQHSQIITATPNKTVLEEKKKKRLMKENKAPRRRGQNFKEVRKRPTNKANEKVKKILFKDDTSSSDESVNYQNICDDNSSDYVNEDSNMCMICCESGKSNEMWYRCRSCGDWSHAQCSGSDSAKDYVCDFCIRL